MELMIGIMGTLEKSYNWVQLCFVFAGVTPEMEILMQRRIYPFLLMVVSLIGILSFQIRQFKRLYEHIKNDKYETFSTHYSGESNMFCLFCLFFFKLSLSYIDNLPPPFFF